MERKCRLTSLTSQHFDGVARPTAANVIDGLHLHLVLSVRLQVENEVVCFVANVDLREWFIVVVVECLASVLDAVVLNRIGVARVP